MYHNFFIHSSLSAHLDCFHVLAIINTAAMNFEVHVSFWIMVFSGYMPNSRISSTYGSFVRTSLMAQQLKNLPAMQATQAMVQSLGRKASLEEEMVTHSSILAISTYPSAIVLTLIYICIRKDFSLSINLSNIAIIWHDYLLFFEEDTGKFYSLQFSSFQPLSRLRIFATAWNTECQASLSMTNSRSLFRLKPIDSVMRYSHLVLSCPVLLLPPIPPSIRVFSNE